MPVRVLSILLFMAALSPAYGQTVVRLSDDENLTPAEFGHALAFSGDVLLVGSSAPTAAGNYAGVVFEYQLVDGRWQVTERIESPTSVAGQSFGRNIAATDSLLLVAGDDGNAVLFGRGPEGWLEQNRIPLDRAYKYWSDVALSGDYAFLSTLGPTPDGGVGSDGGAVLVYERADSGWQHVQTLIASQELEEYDGDYGRTLCLSGDRLFVSAQRDRTRGEHAGAVYIYQRTNDVWVEEAKILPGEGNSRQFGQAMACIAEQVVVLTLDEALRIIDRTENGWIERSDRVSLPAEVHTGEHFYSRAFFDDSALFLASEDIPGSGAVSLFDLTGSDWTYQMTRRAPSPIIFDGFGQTLATHASFIAIGAPYEARLDTLSNGELIRIEEAGAVYVYDRTLFTSTALEQPDALPTTAHLAPAYPNPFRDRTTIPFELAVDARVSLRVFDVLGRQLATLREAHTPAGAHRVEWNGRTVDGRMVPGGLYLVELIVDGRQSVTRVVMIR